MTLLYTTAGGRVKQKKGNFRKKVVCRPEKQCVEKENGPSGEKKVMNGRKTHTLE
jgi:hypothetical protein